MYVSSNQLFNTPRNHLMLYFQALGVENEDDIHNLAMYFCKNDSEKENIVGVDQG